MSNLIVLIMAGGLGKRMNSDIPKVLHNVDFKQNLRKSVINLNFIYILLAFNIAMTLTNWGTIAYNKRNESSLESGSASMWITASAAWICIVLYIFQLLIPSFNILPKSVWDLNLRAV